MLVCWIFVKIQVLAEKAIRDVWWKSIWKCFLFLLNAIRSVFNCLKSHLGFFQRHSKPAFNIPLNMRIKYPNGDTTLRKLIVADICLIKPTKDRSKWKRSVTYYAHRWSMWHAHSISGYGWEIAYPLRKWAIDVNKVTTKTRIVNRVNNAFVKNVIQDYNFLHKFGKINGQIRTD